MCFCSLCSVQFLVCVLFYERCGRFAPAAGAPRPLRALRAHAYDTGAGRPRGSLREPQLASLASLLLSRLAGFYRLPDWQRQSVLPIRPIAYRLLSTGQTLALWRQIGTRIVEPIEGRVLWLL